MEQIDEKSDKVLAEFIERNKGRESELYDQVKLKLMELLYDCSSLQEMIQDIWACCEPTDSEELETQRMAFYDALAEIQEKIDRITK